MKIKHLAVVAAAALAATSLAACAGGDRAAARTVKVYMPDGAPAIALSALMDSGYADAEFTVVPASSIAGHVSSGACDMAIMPINAAATLYNKGVDIVMLTVNTHGNLYVVGDGDASDLSALKGSKLGVIGQGQVPDLTLRMLLDGAEIPYAVSDSAAEGSISLTYAADGGTLLPMLKTGKVDYALLAEPAVTTAASKLEKSILIDMQSEWEKAFGGEYPQACLVAKKSLVNSDKAYVDAFIAAVKESDGWAEENPDKAVAAVGAHMQSGAATSLTALSAPTVKRCNIRTVSAAEQKESCAAFFERLTAVKTELGTAALAKAPDDGFYYKP